MKKKKIFITKTKYVAGMRCPKNLYKQIYHPHLLKAPTEAEMVNIEDGNIIDAMAKQHPFFAGGVNIEEKYDREKVVKDTLKAIKDPNVNHIYEAGFIVDNIFPCFVRVDILQKNDDGTFDLIEAKSSSKNDKKEHEIDIAFQKWVLNKAGFPVKNAYLMNLNGEYSRLGDIDPIQLFKLTPMDNNPRVMTHYENVPANLQRFKEILNQAKEPVQAIGSHCKSPFVCPLKDTCYANINDDSVENLTRLHKNKRRQLNESNIKYIKDIPLAFPLTLRQSIQRDVAKSGVPHLNMEAITDFVESLNFPLYHLDFEAANRAIPPFDGMSPNQFLTFQASIHREDKKRNLSHFEFLHTDYRDPRIRMAKFLINTLGKNGDIIVFNKAFEESRIKDLAKQVPEYYNELMALVPRLKDLAIPFQNTYFYHEAFAGSYSIKKVLPVMVPELSYDKLYINNGADAQARYLNLMDGQYSASEAKKVIKGLLEYCKLDTYAMVKILWVLSDWVEMYKQGNNEEAILSAYFDDLLAA